MPIAASKSADPPKIVISSMFNRCRDVSIETMSSMFVMFVTGTLLFYAAPVARYENIFFRFKMTALAMAVINIWLFRRNVYRRVDEWDLDPVPPRRVRMVGALSLLLLALIITAGRMMAYQDYWFG